MSKHSKPKKRVKEYRKYDPSMKRELARRYRAGEFSYRVAAEEYGLPNKDTAKEFVRWYDKRLATDQAAIANSVSLESPPSQPDLSARTAAELEEEIVRLKKQLNIEQTKAEAWRTMVHKAEEITGIDIVKKLAPKPS